MRQNRRNNGQRPGDMLKRIMGKEQPQELGFGKNITAEGRLMNADGTFNVERDPPGPFANTYFTLVSMSWARFLGLTFISFGLINSLFALVYLSIGIENFNGARPEKEFFSNFSQMFFFSSQTLTTVGYGHVSPSNFTASLIASFESFLGLLTFALISGLLYSRFSLQRAKLVFSEKMLVSPYKDGKGIMFRIANGRKSELIDTEVRATLALNQMDENGNAYRRFYTLKLEIDKIMFFSLSWTLVHAVTEDSPMFGLTQEDFLQMNGEIMVLVKATEEANHQSVHARRSYIAEELVWDAKFLPVMSKTANGIPRVLTNKIGDYAPLS